MHLYYVYTHMFNAFNKILKILFWSVLTWLFIRVFILQIARIPSDSMNQTLQEGDYILINKSAYGARLPITPLSLSFSSKSLFLDWIQLPYWRIPGYSNVKRNEIIVFNFPLDDHLPVDERKKYVKRCIAIPGDTLSCENTILYVNKKQVSETASILLNYVIHSKEQLLTKKTADSLSHKSYSNISRKIIDTGAYSPSFFPNNAFVRWNPDHFGPLYIPKRGDTILLNRKNVILYQRIIEQYEHQTLQEKDTTFFINGKQSVYYIFKMDYYFVMGDNRYHSNDSRFWGFLPEDHLIGNVSFSSSSYQ